MTGLFGGKHLLDTSVFISASNHPFIPEDQACLEEILNYVKPAREGHIIECNRGFWPLLVHANALGKIVSSVDVVRAEILQGEDTLTEWTRRAPEGFFESSAGSDTEAHFSAILASVKARPQFSGDVVDEYFHAADSRLVAHAKAVGAAVVTLEKRRDAATSIVPIPSVCAWEGIACMDTSDMLRSLKAILLP